MNRTIRQSNSPADVLVGALADHPNATTTELVEHTGMGRSTATKALAALAAAGKVRRHEGGRDSGRRLPDRWSLPTRTKRGAKTTTPRNDASADKLGKGELVKLVLHHLQTNAGEHSPTAIAHALGGRSAGAVANALDRLVVDGAATQTSAKPRRYQAAKSN